MGGKPVAEFVGCHAFGERAADEFGDGASRKVSVEPSWKQVAVHVVKGDLKKRVFDDKDPIFRSFAVNDELESIPVTLIDNSDFARA